MPTTKALPQAQTNPSQSAKPNKKPLSQMALLKKRLNSKSALTAPQPKPNGYCKETHSYLVHSNANFDTAAGFFALLHAGRLPEPARVGRVSLPSKNPSWVWSGPERQERQERQEERARWARLGSQGVGQREGAQRTLLLVRECVCPFWRLPR